MKVLVGLLAALAFGAAGCSGARVSAMKEASSLPMGARASGQAMRLVHEETGYYNGEEVPFARSEPSDYKVAALFPRMVGLQVVLVPSFAMAPEAALADVYVFRNGVEGGGPLGFQADVLDSVPGEIGYSPLRVVVLVTWRKTAKPHVLRSVEEIAAAESGRQVNLERTGTVVHTTVLSGP